MPTYDVIVIGGGIAGLYASLRCCQAGMSVCALEKDERWGGRIRTIHNGSDIYEAGGARFHEKHKYLIRLLKRYNIETVKLDNRQREFRAVLCSSEKDIKKTKSPAYALIKEVVKKSKKYTPAFLRSITFGQFTELLLGATKKEIARLSFGYDGEFDAINAYDGVRMFQKDFDASERYYICKNGLGELIEEIVNELKDTPRFLWEGHTEHRVLNIEHTDGMFVVHASKIDGTKYTLKSRIVIAALPKEALATVYPWDTEQMKAIDTVHNIPCERIYAKYKTAWFKDIRATTTDLPLRQFIPITDRVAMISYSDTKHADEWNHTASQGKKTLVARLHKELKELFPEKEVPISPLWIDAYYWKDAIHMWKPDVNSTIARKRIQTGLWKDADMPFYVCGEAYSSHQCWVDGALETVEQIMPALRKRAQKKHAGGNESTKWKDWVHSKTNNMEKKLTKNDLNELRKLYPDAKWVLYQDKFIDLTEWYYMHPGGQTPYDNHMHKDVYPFFNKISSHFDASNEKIKDGILKKIETLTIAHVKT